MRKLPEIMGSKPPPSPLGCPEGCRHRSGMVGHCHTRSGARRHPFQPPSPGLAGPGRCRRASARARATSLAICSCRAAALANLASARTKPMNSTSICAAVQVAVEIEQEHLQHRLAVVERRPGAEIGGTIEAPTVDIDAHGVDAVRQGRARAAAPDWRWDSRGRCRAWRRRPRCPPRATSGRASRPRPRRRPAPARRGWRWRRTPRRPPPPAPPPSRRSHARRPARRSVSGSPVRPLPKRKS